MTDSDASALVDIVATAGAANLHLEPRLSDDRRHRPRPQAADIAMNRTLGYFAPAFGWPRCLVSERAE